MAQEAVRVAEMGDAALIIASREEALTSEGAAITRGHITPEDAARFEAEIMRLIEEGAVFVLPGATEIAYLRPKAP